MRRKQEIKKLYQIRIWYCDQKKLKKISLKLKLLEFKIYRHMIRNLSGRLHIQKI